MKKMTAIALATVLGFSISFAQEKTAAEPAEKPQAEQPAKQADKQKKQANRRAKMIAKRTQKLNEGAAEILDAFDKDKDGKLSEQEKQDIQDAVDKARKTLMLANRFKMIQKIDENGDMVITEAELEAKFDTLQQMHKNHARPGKRAMNRGQQQR